MKLNGRAFLFSLFSLLVLSGCAGLPEGPPVDDPAAAWQARAARLAPLTNWEVLGRMALRTPEESWQATLLWVRRDDSHKIDLTGPLGRGHLRLTQDRDGAQLRDADQRTYRDSSAQQLLLRATGWQVPLEGLNYWILGLPAPEADSGRDLDERGRLSALRQSGWDIRFMEYARYDGYDLPSKLFIKRRAAPGERVIGADPANDSVVELRLVIERWTFNRRDP